HSTSPQTVWRVRRTQAAPPQRLGVFCIQLGVGCTAAGVLGESLSAIEVSFQVQPRASFGSLSPVPALRTSPWHRAGSACPLSLDPPSEGFPLRRPRTTPAHPGPRAFPGRLAVGPRPWSGLPSTQNPRHPVLSFSDPDSG